MLKLCKDCHQEKPKEEFYDHWRNRVDGKHYKKTHCKSCSHKRVKQWRQTPKGQYNQRKYNLKKTYNISPEDWDSILKKQDSKCAICNRSFNDLKMIPYVDHNHTTGIVRGLLCLVCNQFLGLIKDNPRLLLNYINPFKD